VEALPDRLAPDSLRRTFASVLFAIGEPPPYVMPQLGYTTPSFTLANYARAMDRRNDDPERLKALVKGREYSDGTSVSGSREPSANSPAPYPAGGLMSRTHVR